MSSGERKSVRSTNVPAVGTTLFALASFVGLFSHINVQAFGTAAMTARPSFVQLQRLSALQYRRGNEDDSQWYSPPPPPTPPQSVPTTTLSTTATQQPQIRQKAVQTEVTSMDELNAILGDESDDRLVVVKFYASWCRTCASVGLRMDKLAAEHADWRESGSATSSASGSVTEQTRRGQARFVNVEYGAAREMFKELKIERLPTIFMYTTTTMQSGMEKVQDFSVTVKDFSRVQDLTLGYIQQQQRQKEAAVVAETAAREAVAASADNADLAAFELTLDAGRDLIQAKLADELPAIADQVYSQSMALVTRDTDDANADADASPKGRFWQRFRK